MKVLSVTSRSPTESQGLLAVRFLLLIQHTPSYSFSKRIPLYSHQFFLNYRRVQTFSYRFVGNFYSSWMNTCCCCDSTAKVSFSVWHHRSSPVTSCSVCQFTAVCRLKLFRCSSLESYKCQHPFAWNSSSN